MRQKPPGGDSAGSSNLDARPPRLVTRKRERREEKIRAALNGDADRRARARVTLPRFSFDKDPI